MIAALLVVALIFYLFSHLFVSRNEEKVGQVEASTDTEQAAETMEGAFGDWIFGLVLFVMAVAALVGASVIA